MRTPFGKAGPQLEDVLPNPEAVQPILGLGGKRLGATISVFRQTVKQSVCFLLYAPRDTEHLRKPKHLGSDGLRVVQAPAVRGALGLRRYLVVICATLWG